MDPIERAALISVGRGCGFGGLAIFCFMAGLSFQPVLAVTTGGILLLLMTAVLVLRAIRARTLPYKSTEMWLILAQEQRPPATVAQRIVGNVMRTTYFDFAHRAALGAAVLLTSSVGLRLMEWVRS
ncbi:MAG: hypothetical protein NW217_06555 [Hyphomicrobiaceae bacterium]|nr:hypothetical protein [Hyphomicrobiaceae bacterium]